MQLLKKLSDDHYIIVDEQIQPVTGYYYDSYVKAIRNTSGAEYGEANHCLQITHSTQPIEYVKDKDEFGTHYVEGFDKVKFLDTFYLKELLGEFDVEKKLNDYVQELIDCKSVKEHEKTWISAICHKIYNQCLEDNKDIDKTTEILNHLCDKMELITQEMIDKDQFQLGRYRTFKYMFDYIKSLTQPKDTWEVYFDEKNNLKLK